jgi:predicted enzyme related to lactoylglutathione lyase
MTVELVALAIDAVAPAELARFWAHALRWDLREDAAGAVELVPTDHTTFRLLFRAGATAKARQNPIHFDLTTTSVDDQERQVANLLANGARPVDIGQCGDEGHVVLADPEGNELCVIEPGNSFLAGCPRLGAVNCDGTRALGHFFSAVLGWPLIWHQDEETAIESPAGSGPKITWSGPPLMPKSSRERVHFHLAPAADATAKAALDQLLQFGAARLDVAGQGCQRAVSVADVDGNKLCLVEPQSSG